MQDNDPIHIANTIKDFIKGQANQQPLTQMSGISPPEEETLRRIEI